ncbi:MAG: TetR/AcrR family transcriptional regulator [Halieaceae bacterium]|nr:TetR/AcrR family transcriptional regulator [Halieaceae bacterium]
MGKKPVSLATSDGVKVRCRRVPKQERSIESRAKAIRGARSALQKFGYSKLTMRNVAAESEVGIGTIYDYFPSKHAMLRQLLKERLTLRLEIFDETYEAMTPDIPVSTFIDRYLDRVREEVLWSRFDVELHRAAEDDDEMQSLIDWHHDETVNRYMTALRAAGSKWPVKDLEAVASYLSAISAQFEPGAVAPMSAHSKIVTSWMIRRTFLMLVSEVLTKPARQW